ncbi:hypothetical protein DLREEDagrD3_00950 [Denitratisoma sp. agr-D3]
MQTRTSRLTRIRSKCPPSSAWAERQIPSMAMTTSRAQCPPARRTALAAPIVRNMKNPGKKPTTAAANGDTMDQA